MIRNFLLFVSFSISLALFSADSKVQKQDSQKPSDKAAKPPSREDRQKEEFKAKIMKALQEAKSISLRPWPTVDKKDLATEPGKYKARTKDGKVLFPEKIEDRDYPEYSEIFRKESTGVMVNTGDGWVPTNRWDPIYWSEKEKKWLTTPPAQKDFLEEKGRQELIIALMENFCKQQDYMKCNYNVGVIKNAGPSCKPEEKAKMIAEIDALSATAGASWGGGEVLAKIFKLSIDINSEQDPSKLISLSGERLKLLESAVSLISKK